MLTACVKLKWIPCERFAWFLVFEISSWSIVFHTLYNQRIFDMSLHYNHIRFVFLLYCPVLYFWNLNRSQISTISILFIRGTLLLWEYFIDLSIENFISFLRLIVSYIMSDDELVLMIHVNSLAIVSNSCVTFEIVVRIFLIFDIIFSL